MIGISNMLRACAVLSIIGAGASISACAYRLPLYAQIVGDSTTFQGIYYYTGDILAPRGLITYINNDESVVRRIIIAEAIDFYPGQNVHHGQIIRGRGRIVNYCDYINQAYGRCRDIHPGGVLIIESWERVGFYKFRRNILH